jgi:RNA 2',3'-cyclic 3'-phosphodiesterase
VRLFTAVYPSDEALSHVDLAVHGVGGPAATNPGPGLRWVPPEQRHVTLAFHGEVPDGAVPGYVEAMEEALREVRPFELALAGSGSFGGRTLWIGLGGDVTALRRLAGVVTSAAEEAGLPVENRAGGRPHLTVARASVARAGAARKEGRRGSRRPRGRDDEAGSPLATWSRALAVYGGPAWPVRDVHVVASRLGAGRDHPIDARAFYRSRTDSVDPNAVIAQLHRQGFGETDDGPLRSGIRGPKRIAEAPGDRSDVDDGA